MHNQLERYLQDVVQHLMPLPAVRRQEELREIRQHLRNAIIANQKLGQSEDEAATNAIKQFGTPAALADNLVWAWRREQVISRRSFWGAAVCAYVFSWIVWWMTQPFEHRLVNFYILHFHVHTFKHGILWDLPLYESGLKMLVIGTITGLLFPKRARDGVCLTCLVWLTISSVFIIRNYFQSPLSFSIRWEILELSIIRGSVAYPMWFSRIPYSDCVRVDGQPVVRASVTAGAELSGMVSD